MCFQRWCLALELLFLLHLLLATSTQGCSKYQVTAISGSNVSLQISNLSTNYEQLTWLYSVHQKILEWELNKINLFNSKFKNRVSLNGNQALSIVNVQKEDSSTYILRVLKESGKEEEWHISLEVFDPVPQPNIEIQKKQEVNNFCHLQLSCKIPDQSITYTWYGNSRVLAKGPQSFMLEVTVNSENHSTSYTCEVSNPVSSKNDTVYFTLPCQLDFSVSWEDPLA